MLIDFYDNCLWKSVEPRSPSTHFVPTLTEGWGFSLYQMLVVTIDGRKVGCLSVRSGVVSPHLRVSLLGDVVMDVSLGFHRSYPPLSGIRFLEGSWKDSLEGVQGVEGTTTEGCVFHPRRLLVDGHRFDLPLVVTTVKGGTERPCQSSPPKETSSSSTSSSDNIQFPSSG